MASRDFNEPAAARRKPQGPLPCVWNALSRLFFGVARSFRDFRQLFQGPSALPGRPWKAFQEASAKASEGCRGAPITLQALGSECKALGGPRSLGEFCEHNVELPMFYTALLTPRSNIAMAPPLGWLTLGRHLSRIGCVRDNLVDLGPNLSEFGTHSAECRAKHVKIGPMPPGLECATKPAHSRKKGAKTLLSPFLRASACDH